jgi:hypothetical protein
MGHIYPQNELGQFQYLVIAYRPHGDTLWRIAACPPPFEKTNDYFLARGINPAEVRCVCDTGIAGEITWINSFAIDRAIECGWKRQDFNDKGWYAPEQKMPMFPGMETASEEPIRFKLMNIYVSLMVIEFSQGDNIECLGFDCLLSDPLPWFGDFVRLLKKYGYGSFTVSDAFFFALHAWLDEGETVYMRMRFHVRGYYESHWDCKMPLKNLLESLGSLFGEIVNHPDFVGEYAFFENEREEKYTQRYEQAWIDYQKASKFDASAKVPLIILKKWCRDDADLELDEEDSFKLFWNRKHILELPEAVRWFEYYKDILKV